MSKIKCELTFEMETALHIGSGALSPEAGAAEILRNGNDEYCIPGSTFAGLFFDRLGRLSGYDSQNSLALQGAELKNSGNEKQALRASHLVFRSAVIPGVVEMVRDHVRIDRRLKSAEDGGKFAQWQIPPLQNGLPLRVCTSCELDFHSFTEDKLNPAQKDPPVKSAASIHIEEAKKAMGSVFESWKTDGLFIGAFASSGMGWAKLADVKCDGQLPEPAPRGKSLFKVWKLRLTAGDEPDGYGTNGLLVRAGEGQLSFRYLLDDKQTGEIDPLLDAVFMHDGDRLFIPGSSLKGALSFHIQKYKAERHWLKDLLGQEEEGQKAEKAGLVFFRDLFAEDFNPAHLLTIERHAEDEFTRAIYGSGKFDEERLFRTTFAGEIRAYRLDCEDGRIGQLISFIRELADKRLFSLGAQACHPIIEITEKES